MTLVPLPERVPTGLLPPTAPSTDQVTEVLVEPETVAVKALVAPVVREAEPEGLRAMLTGVAWTVTVADALDVVLAALVAVMVWLPAAEGAV